MKERKPLRIEKEKGILPFDMAWRRSTFPLTVMMATEIIVNTMQIHHKNVVKCFNSLCLFFAFTYQQSDQKQANVCASVVIGKTNIIHFASIQPKLNRKLKPVTMYKSM